MKLLLLAAIVTAHAKALPPALVAPPVPYGIVWTSYFSGHEPTLHTQTCRDTIGYPEQGLAYARIETRLDGPDHGWVLTWTLGLAKCAGSIVTYGIPWPASATWIRRATVDSTGNVSCWSDSELYTR